MGRAQITLCLGWACFAACLVGLLVPSAPRGRAQAVPPPTRLTVSLTPEREPLPTTVTLTAQGTVQAVRFSSSTLEVHGTRSGTAAPADRDRVLKRLQEPAVRGALQKQNFSGAGLSRGDQFVLLTQGPAGGGRCFGFLADTQSALQTLVRELLALGNRVPVSTAQPAYLRAEAIPTTRLNQMRQANRVRFLRPAEVTDAIRKVLAEAAAAPLEFQPLELAAYRTALTYCSHGHEFFYLLPQGGFQITLFRRRTNQPTNLETKEVKR